MIIKENEDPDARMFYFPCQKWLDEGEDDGKIERELLAAEPPKQTSKEKLVQYWRDQMEMLLFHIKRQCYICATLLQLKINYYTVDPVLKDHPIGHRNIVSEDRWSW